MGQQKTKVLQDSIELVYQKAEAKKQTMSKTCVKCKAYRIEPPYICECKKAEQKKEF